MCPIDDYPGTLEWLTDNKLVIYAPHTKKLKEIIFFGLSVRLFVRPSIHAACLVVNPITVDKNSK